MKLGLTAILGCMCAFSGCAVGPDYQTPEMNLPDTFQEDTSASEAMMSVNLTRWWETFADPELNKLINAAVGANLDVRLATAKMREARAALSFAIGGVLPAVDADATFLRSDKSDNLGAGPLSTQVSENGITSTSGPTNLYMAGFDASWEMNLFGGRRREIEAARGMYESEVEARRNTLITFLAELAQNYTALRGYQEQLAIAKKNAEAQRETLELQRLKLAAGIANDLTVAQAEAQLAETESKIPTLETQIKQAIHRLSVLSDRNPGALVEELAVPSILPAGPPVVPAGLPSELLRRRPDVKQAERILAAATANIGVAVANLFPKINLAGSFGVQSLAFSNLDQSGSRFWATGGTVTLPLFQGGRLISNIRIQDARQEQALIQYRQSVLRSLEEVENTLIAYNREQARRDLLNKSVESNRRAVDLAKQLYGAGVVDFLNVLTAQQSLFESEDELAVSDINVARNLIALYKALGGGWETLG